MARFRSRNYLRPINTKKHIIDSQGGLVAAAQTAVILADAVDAPVLGSPQQVAVGSTVKSFFLNVQVAASGSGALANVYLIVFKNPSNALSLPNGNVVGTSDVKKIIFHQEMTMTEKNTTAIARTLFKGVLKVPAHMQRMGQDDVLGLALFSPGVTFDFCVQCIYKEIR